MLVKCFGKYAVNLMKNTRINFFSTTAVNFESVKCKVLVIGGGTGGCAIAAKFTRLLGRNSVVVLEPSERHYYQPMYTLIGVGLDKPNECYRSMRSVLPKKATWIQDSVDNFSPEKKFVSTKSGQNIEYEYMVLALGIEPNFSKIPGLVDALSISDGPVCSAYAPEYCERTYKALQQFDGGNAIFTVPNTLIKCPGAPQTMVYLIDHYLRKEGKRENATLFFNTALQSIFRVGYYVESMCKVAKKRSININLNTNLVKITGRNTAIFENLTNGQQFEVEFNLLHVTPPMSAPTVLSNCKELVNQNGFVDVDDFTLQHKRFGNVFAIGDCSGSPNPKTAASVAVQTNTTYKNILALMKGEQPKTLYNGYSSCPVVTSLNTCIMAEFDYNLQPLETFPIDQRKESRLMFIMKKHIMPLLYWNLLIKGYWNGPEIYRKMFSFIKF